MNNNDTLLEELQSLWDEQGQRLDRLLVEHREAQTRMQAEGRYRLSRRRLVAECIILLAFTVATAVYAVVMLLPDPYILMRITGYVLVATSILMVGRCLYVLFHAHLRNVMAMAFTYTRQVATVSVTAMAVLVCIYCLTPGDGYAMSKTGSADRTAAIEIVNEITGQE